MNIQGFISCLIGIVLIYIFVYYRKQKIVEGQRGKGGFHSASSSGNTDSGGGLFDDPWRKTLCKECKDGWKDKYGHKYGPTITGSSQLTGSFHEILRCIPCTNVFGQGGKFSINNRDKNVCSWYNPRCDTKKENKESNWEKLDKKIVDEAKKWEDYNRKRVRYINFKELKKMFPKEKPLKDLKLYSPVFDHPYERNNNRNQPYSDIYYNPEPIYIEREVLDNVPVSYYGLPSKLCKNAGFVNEDKSYTPTFYHYGPHPTDTKKPGHHRKTNFETPSESYLYCNGNIKDPTKPFHLEEKDIVYSNKKNKHTLDSYYCGIFVPGEVHYGGEAAAKKLGVNVKRPADLLKNIKPKIRWNDQHTKNNNGENGERMYLNSDPLPGKHPLNCANEIKNAKQWCDNRCQEITDKFKTKSHKGSYGITSDWGYLLPEKLKGKELCQWISNTYGVKPKGKWFRTPPEYRNKWVKGKCNTRPEKGKKLCQWISNTYGAQPNNWGDTPLYYRLEWNNGKCNTKPNKILKKTKEQKLWEYCNCHTNKPRKSSKPNTFCFEKNKPWYKPCLSSLDDILKSDQLYNDFINCDCKYVGKNYGKCKDIDNKLVSTNDKKMKEKLHNLREIIGCGDICRKIFYPSKKCEDLNNKDICQKISNVKGTFHGDWVGLNDIKNVKYKTFWNKHCAPKTPDGIYPMYSNSVYNTSKSPNPQRCQILSDFYGASLQGQSKTLWNRYKCDKNKHYQTINDNILTYNGKQWEIKDPTEGYPINENNCKLITRRYGYDENDMLDVTNKSYQGVKFPTIKEYKQKFCNQKIRDDMKKKHDKKKQIICQELSNNKAAYNVNKSFKFLGKTYRRSIPMIGLLDESEKKQWSLYSCDTKPWWHYPEAQQMSMGKVNSQGVELKGTELCQWISDTYGTQSGNWSKAYPNGPWGQWAPGSSRWGWKYPEKSSSDPVACNTKPDPKKKEKQKKLKKCQKLSNEKGLVNNKGVISCAGCSDSDKREFKNCTTKPWWHYPESQQMSMGKVNSQGVELKGTELCQWISDTYRTQPGIWGKAYKNGPWGQWFPGAKKYKWEHPEKSRRDPVFCNTYPTPTPLTPEEEKQRAANQAARIKLANARRKRIRRKKKNR